MPKVCEGIDLELVISLLWRSKPVTSNWKKLEAVLGMAARYKADAYQMLKD